MSGRLLVAAILGSTVALVVAVAPAFANTSTALTTTVTAVQAGPNSGPVVVTVSGTWDWPGQACNGRYGTSWAIGWWGVGSSATPLPTLQVTNVSLITAANQGQGGTSVSTGTQTAAGSWQINAAGDPLNGKYLYVGSEMNGQQIFTTSFCNQFGTTGYPSGTYTATATYANPADVPAEICVNTYDIHFDAKGPYGAKASDYIATGNGDNSIHSKGQFSEKANCGTTSFTILPAGGSIGPLGLTGLVALGALLLFGGSAVIRRRRRATVHVD